jgi:hypothetical protein
MAGLPPELATASPEQMQQAVQMFGQLHPELASHLPTGDSPMDVQSVLNHLANIPPEALAGFTPSTGGTAEFGDLGGGLGGPLDGDFGDLTDLGDTFSDFAGLGDAGGTTADFGAVPAILNGGPELDISALQGFGVDLEGQYGDLPAMAEATDTGFSLDDLLGATSGLAEPEPVGADTFESFDSFDPSIAAFDDADTAYGADPLQPDDITAINEDQYNQ